MFGTLSEIKPNRNRFGSLSEMVAILSYSTKGTLERQPKFPETRACAILVAKVRCGRSSLNTPTCPCGRRRDSEASTVASALVFRGPWQAERGLPCRHPQAKRKSPLRPVYAVLRPFVGSWLQKSLYGPLGSSGQCSFRHGSCTDRLARLWLYMVRQ